MTVSQSWCLTSSITKRNGTLEEAGKNLMLCVSTFRKHTVLTILWTLLIGLPTLICRCAPGWGDNFILPNLAETHRSLLFRQISNHAQHALACLTVRCGPTGSVAVHGVIWKMTLLCSRLCHYLKDANRESDRYERST